MKKIPLTVSLLGIFIGILVLCFGLNALLTVHTIQIDGTKTLIGLDELSRKPIFLLNTQQAQKKLLEKNPTFEHISIEKIYPNTIRIDATKTSVVGVLHVSEGYYEISAGGKVISKSRNKREKIPLITIGQQFPYDAYRVGETMGEHEVVVAAFLLAKLHELGMHIDTVEMRGFDVLVCKDTEHTYFFSVSEDQRRQYADFSTVYRQFFVEGKKYRSIDVRFEKPIVIFEQ